MKRNPVSESSSIQCTVVSTMLEHRRNKPEQTGDIPPLKSIGHSVKKVCSAWYTYALHVGLVLYMQLEGIS